MKKEIKCDCDKCDCIIDTHYVCDVCGGTMPFETITMSFGYGSGLDGEEYHFDKYKCVLRFILEELKKEQKENYSVGGKK